MTEKGDFVQGKCRRCGCVLASEQTTEYCSPCQKAMPLVGESDSEAKLRAFAIFYGYAQREEASLRRFEEHVQGFKEPRVLGVVYADGMYSFYCEPGQIKGPLPGGERKILLPPETNSVVPFCSGLTSGLPSVSALHLDKKHCEATIRVESCHSGNIVQVFHYI